MKKLSIFLSIILCIALLSGCASNDDVPQTTIQVASLKGPTTMGMVKLMNDAKEDNTSNNYEFNVYGTADEIVPQLVNKEVDIALVPCNLASVLYNKTEGAVQVAGINTLGVLYILESGDSVQSIEDLKGKTIYSVGKGTTPEFSLNYILAENGIEPGVDVSIEYKSEATELAAILSQAENTIAVLPQPYATVVQTKNPNVRLAIDFTEEWEKISDDSTLVTGVLLARKEFVENNSKAFESFLDEYQASTKYVNENPEEAAKWIEEYGIVPNVEIGVKAIPKCNITFIEGDEMKAKVSGYLEVLFDANPNSVGGKLPEDDFYFIR
ncbi:MAG: ABC transporter substrate-binding protein [Clostridiales bacterium]|jgi:NitT/TauT family transport system substrate-binding protein|nr:ABC transporter substrate-binding protein [Clostridiales bacterium]